MGAKGSLATAGLSGPSESNAPAGALIWRGRRRRRIAGMDTAPCCELRRARTASASSEHGAAVMMMMIMANNQAPQLPA